MAHCMRKSHMHMLLQASTHDTVAAATADAHLHPQVRDALGLPAWFTYFLLATRANTRSWTGVAILERRDLTPPLPCARAPTGRKAKWDVPVVAGRSVCPHNSPILRSGPHPVLSSPGRKTLCGPPPLPFFRAARVARAAGVSSKPESSQAVTPLEGL